MEHQDYNAARLIEQDHYKAMLWELRAKAVMWGCFGVSSLLISVALFVQV